MNVRLGRQARRLSAAALLGGLVLAGASVPAHAAAAPTGRIEKIVPTAGRLHIVFSGQNLAQGQSIDPKTATVAVEGRSLSGVVAQPLDPTAAKALDRTVILVLDTSGSMTQNGKIQQAKAAATAYVNAMPEDVKLGLVTFEDRPSTLVAPTKDRARMRSAINAVKVNPNGGTALYDGVVEAVKLAGAEGPQSLRSLLLLTDGADTTSGKGALAQAEAAISSSKVGADAVALPGSNNAVLATLVQPAKGTVIAAADASGLTRAFQQAAKNVTSQIVIDVPLPADLGITSGNVTVTAKAGKDTLSDVSNSALTGGPAASATPSADSYGPKPVAVSTPLVGRSALPFALGALFIGLAAILLVALTSVGNRDGREGRVRRRLSIYTFTGRQPVKQQETTALGDSNVARSAVEFAGKVVAKRDFEEMLGLRLEAAGVPLRSAEWLLIHVGMTLGLGLLFLLVFGGSLLPALIGLALGFLAPYLYLSIKETRRTSAFLAQLPDTLQLLAGSLSAGYSLPQAVDTVVREGQPPITVEFNRALVEARLGVPLEDALEGVGTRMKSKDFAWVVMAIRIQREVGGNLAEVLSTVAATLRERERLRRQVQVLSAEGRLSAWILGLLPVVFALYLVLVRPDYLHPLFTQALGWVMIVVGSVLLVTGAFWLRKVVRVEV